MLCPLPRLVYRVFFPSLRFLSHDIAVAFRIYDIKNDGFIDAEELLTVLKMLVRVDEDAEEWE